MLSPKAKYRVACARDELEKAAEALERTSSWLDFEDMSNTPDSRYLQAAINAQFANLALLDTDLEGML